MDVIQPSSRRTFLKQGGLAAGGLVIGFFVSGGPAGRRASAESTDGPPPKPPLDPNAFLRIAPDGAITVLLAHSEMGQGIWTTLAMLVAEELDVELGAIGVEHAPAAPAYAHTAWGMQMTGGSTTTWSEYVRYREVGAMARTMLVQAAATKLGVPVTACRTQDGAVVAGGKRATYGELAEAAAKLPAPASVTLREPAGWRIAGKPAKRLDTAAKITGKAKYGTDAHVEGMLTALVARSPVFGGTVKSFDGAKAKAVNGVRAVVQVPSGVAVVADGFWAAKLGRDALVVDWELGPSSSLDSAKLGEELRKLVRQEGAVATKAGDVAAGLAAATRTVEAEYAVPYLAHATMEPLACAVKAAADGCDVWVGTQFQTVDQQVAAGILGLKPEQVRIHTQFLGGGFGRRANPVSDFVAEAVHVAKAAGAPVKTVWTREDDMRGGYYRPAFVHRARVGLGKEGLPVAWHHVMAGQSILAGTPFEQMMVKDGVDQTSVEGVADSPYVTGLAAHRVELHSPRTGIPVLWWRSVGHSHSAFAMESLLDELALAAKQDPVAYRKLLLKGHPRHLGVLELAASKAGWGSGLPKGRARGIAVHESFKSYVAQVAEVSVEGGEIRVHRVVCAVDCGVVVNPEGVKAQIESGVVYGLSAALHSRITFKEGRVVQSNFHDYELLRLKEMPVVEVHIVPSTEAPGGVGEPGVPPVAPAVANAVAALTGKRLRELPLTLGA